MTDTRWTADGTETDGKFRVCSEWLQSLKARGVTALTDYKRTRFPIKRLIDAAAKRPVTLIGPVKLKYD